MRIPSNVRIYQLRLCGILLWGQTGKAPVPPPQAVCRFKACPHVHDRIQNNIWDEWGWEDATFVGYVDGKPAITKKFAKNPIPHQLSCTADDTVLKAQKEDEPYDVTRVVFEALDQYGNSWIYDGQH